MRHGEPDGIPLRKKLWRILQPALTLDLCLAGGVFLSGLAAAWSLSGQELLDAMYAESVLSSAAACTAAVLILWQPFREDEERFGNSLKGPRAGELLWGMVLLMTAGHLLNALLDAVGFTAFFSAYEELTGDVYAGQNPLLLVCSVGFLSAAAEELVFRGMVYRRAKDFFGAAWGCAVSCLLFGVSHGTAVQFVYASALSVLLAGLYERTGSLWVPFLAHAAENVWGLFRGELLEAFAEKVPAGSAFVLPAEALLLFLAAFYFLRRPGERFRKRG